MAGFWLKMIGTTERPCPDPYALDYADFSRMPPILPGDNMVLYAVGGSKRVFALAEVTSGVRQSGVVRWPYRLSMKYLVNLPVSSGVHLDEISTPNRDLLRSIRRHSYIKLQPDEYARAENKLVEAGLYGTVVSIEPMP